MWTRNLKRDFRGPLAAEGRLVMVRILRPRMGDRPSFLRCTIIGRLYREESVGQLGRYCEAALVRIHHGSQGMFRALSCSVAEAVVTVINLFFRAGNSPH